LQYFPVFDRLKKEFFIGEMIWNFADFMTQQGEFITSKNIYLLLVALWFNDIDTKGPE